VLASSFSVRDSIPQITNTSTTTTTTATTATAAAAARATVIATATAACVVGADDQGTEQQSKSKSTKSNQGSDTAFVDENASAVAASADDGGNGNGNGNDIRVSSSSTCGMAQQQEAAAAAENLASLASSAASSSSSLLPNANTNGERRKQEGEEGTANFDTSFSGQTKSSTGIGIGVGVGVGGFATTTGPMNTNTNTNTTPSLSPSFNIMKHYHSHHQALIANNNNNNVTVQQHAGAATAGVIAPGLTATNGYGVGVGVGAGSIPPVLHRGSGSQHFPIPAIPPLYQQQQQQQQQHRASILSTQDLSAPPPHNFIPQVGIFPPPPSFVDQQLPPGGGGGVIVPQQQQPPLQLPPDLLKAQGFSRRISEASTLDPSGLYVSGMIAAAREYDVNHRGQQQQSEAAAATALPLPPVATNNAVSLTPAIVAPRNIIGGGAVSDRTNVGVGVGVVGGSVGLGVPPVVVPRKPSTTTTSGICPFQFPMVMYQEIDNRFISPFECLLRKELLIFEADDDDVLLSSQSRNVKVGQVGLRCRHCVCSARYIDRATWYPQNVKQMDSIFDIIFEQHFRVNCALIPQGLKQTLVLSQRSRDSFHLVNDRGNPFGDSYWSEQMKTLGAYEDGNGVLRINRGERNNATTTTTTAVATVAAAVIAPPPISGPTLSSSSEGLILSIPTTAAPPPIARTPTSTATLVTATAISVAGSNPMKQESSPSLVLTTGNVHATNNTSARQTSSYSVTANNTSINNGAVHANPNYGMRQKQPTKDVTSHVTAASASAIATINNNNSSNNNKEPGIKENEKNRASNAVAVALPVISNIASKKQDDGDGDGGSDEGDEGQTIMDFDSPVDKNQSSSSSASQASKETMSMSRHDLDICRDLIKKLRGKKYSKFNSLFLFPISASVTPGYLDVCECRMDILTLSQKLENGSYSNRSEFYKACNVIFTNALKYHADIATTQFMLPLAGRMLEIAKNLQQKIEYQLNSVTATITTSTKKISKPAKDTHGVLSQGLILPPAAPETTDSTNNNTKSTTTTTSAGKKVPIVVDETKVRSDNKETDQEDLNKKPSTATATKAASKSQSAVSPPAAIDDPDTGTKVIPDRALTKAGHRQLKSLAPFNSAGSTNEGDNKFIIGRALTGGTRNARRRRSSAPNVNAVATVRQVKKRKVVAVTTSKKSVSSKKRVVHYEDVDEDNSDNHKKRIVPTKKVPPPPSSKSTVKKTKSKHTREVASTTTTSTAPLMPRAPRKRNAPVFLGDDEQHGSHDPPAKTARINAERKRRKAEQATDGQKTSGGSSLPSSSADIGGGALSSSSSSSSTTTKATGVATTELKQILPAPDIIQSIKNDKLDESVQKTLPKSVQRMLKTLAPFNDPGSTTDGDNAFILSTAFASSSRVRRKRTRNSL